jgi:hypothetical protein
MHSEGACLRQFSGGEYMSPKFAFVLVLMCVLPLTVFSQQASPSNRASGNAPAQETAPDLAHQVVQTAMAKLKTKATVAIRDITLSGTAESLAGSTHETGTAVLKATADGSSEIDLSFPSGQRKEVRANTALGPMGSWIGPDGVRHAIAPQNLFTDGTWFLPAFTLNRVKRHNLALKDASVDTKDGADYVRVAAFEGATRGTAEQATRLEQLTKMELRLDSNSFLPAALSYNIHPDFNDTVDISVEVRFSDYREVEGTLIPFHIEKFLNGVLNLDIRINSAVANTGLSAKDFVVN